MPKSEIDYSNTIIYKITCKDPSITDIYVGHTTNFVQRKYAHKQACIMHDNQCQLYTTMRENGGWGNWQMEIVGTFKCKHHYEAKKKEQEYCNILHATLNSVEELSAPPQPKMVVNKIIYHCNTCNVTLKTESLMNIHNQTNKHLKRQIEYIEQNAKGRRRKDRVGA